MKAIILAAGQGERLRPITDLIPKPLLPVIAHPMIELNIKRLLNYGIEKIGINLFHKAEPIKNFLKKYPTKMNVVVEDELTGTGGALINFKKFLKEDFIFQSCDVISDINLEEIIDFHKSHNPIATLVLVKHPGIKFKIDNDRRIVEISESEECHHTFAGIAVFSYRLLSFLPPKKFFSILEVFQSILEKGELIMGLPIKINWYNVNSHYSYWKIHHDILHRIFEVPDIEINSPIYAASSSNVKTKNLKGFICIGENSVIYENVDLENTIVLPNSTIVKGNFKNCILSGEFQIPIK